MARVSQWDRNEWLDYMCDIGRPHVLVSSLPLTGSDATLSCTGNSEATDVLEVPQPTRDWP
jgi:hypothetical protein